MFSIQLQKNNLIPCTIFFLLIFLLKLLELDALGVSLIIMEGISESNEGLAVMNRIEKAASVVVHTDNENNS